MVSFSHFLSNHLAGSLDEFGQGVIPIPFTVLLMRDTEWEHLLCHGEGIDNLVDQAKPGVYASIVCWQGKVEDGISNGVLWSYSSLSDGESPEISHIAGELKF